MKNLLFMALLMCGAVLYSQVNSIVFDTCLNCPVAQQQTIILKMDSSYMLFEANKQFAEMEPYKPVNLYLDIVTKRKDILQIWIDGKLIYVKLEE